MKRKSINSSLEKLNQKEKQSFDYQQIQAKNLFNVPEGVINLCVGAPNSELLNQCVPLVKQAMEHRLNQPDVAESLQYGPVRGGIEFLEELAAFLSRIYKDEVSPLRLVCTSGASAGLAMICTMFSKECNIVFAEDPCYFLAGTIFRENNYQVVSVPNDETGGMSLSMLEEKVKMLPPKDPNSSNFRGIVYLVPTFQNPSGTILPDEKRKKVIEIAMKENLLVICDDVYEILNYDENFNIPKRLVAYDQSENGCVISNSSFAKIFNPGFRLGWYEANPMLLKRFVNSGELLSSGSANHFISLVMASALKLGLQDKMISILKEVYKKRKQVLCETIRKEMPSGVSFVEPHGGFFVWISLPPSIDGEKLLETCKAKEKILFVPGKKFSVSGGCINFIRVSFTHYPEDVLADAIKRIAGVIKNLVN